MAPITTTYMQLTLPEVGVTPGPTWADAVEGLNYIIGIIDAHDHTLNKGTLVPVSGLNINADLDLLAFSLLGAKKLTLESQISSLSTNNSLYSLNGELYFIDGSGTGVPITSGGSLAIGATGTINITAGSPTFIYSEPSGTGSGVLVLSEASPMRMDIDCAKIKIREHASGGLKSYIGLQSPSALASDYDLTLPTGLPASTGVATVSNTGIMALVTSLVLTGLQITTGAGLGKMLVSDAAGIATWQDVIPTGTKMMFYQAAAPLGWTADAVNDRFLRVVNSGGSGGTTGGSWAALGAGTLQFQVASTGSTSLVMYDSSGTGRVVCLTVPVLKGTGSSSHDHVGFGAGTHYSKNGTGVTGAHGSSQHQYADVIICTKD